MKELTIEEKAKAYDKVLTNARMFYKDEHVSDDVNNLLEVLFPALKESEGEKIRKALLRFHKSTIDIDGIKGEDILAWLEKQDEQKPVEEYNITGISSKHADGKLGEMIENMESANKVEPKDCSSIDPYFGKPADKTKQEWSMFDKTILKAIIDHFEYKKEFNEAEDYDIVNWLKSLRPQNRWKPSDEQMQVLRWCMPLWAEPKSKAILESLINDLKKLRGE